MADLKGAPDFNIQIESVFNGQTEFAAYGAKDQFLAAYNIDPDQPIADTGVNSYRASGYLRPASVQKIDSSTAIAGAPMWFVSNPKNDSVYVYGSTGSVYALNPDGYTITATTGLDVADSLGNGAEYYDNYIYLARTTDIARYGPLNGAPALTTSYWVGTLSKTALVNTTYPTLKLATKTLPNHVLHRHSDGRLYIADVVGNQGYLHYIKTTKTAVEGDTDDGSTYLALDFPWGWWPIDMETYGTDLAVSLYEGSNDTVTLQKRAKLTFWDTTSDNYSKIIDVEFPDPIITALENVNGVLYTFSGQLGIKGTRVCRFVGGYSFQQVAYIEDSEPPFPGATDHILNRVFFGGTVEYINSGSSLPCVWAMGSKTGKFSGLFNIMGCSQSTSATEITSLAVIDQDGFNFQIPVVGWFDGTNRGIDRQTNDYGRINSIFRSQVFRIGRPFQITKIRLSFGQAIAANMTLTPKIYVDEESSNFTLVTINNTNYPNSERQITLRSTSTSGDIVGKHNFFLELTWSGSALLTVILPISIEGIYLND